MILKCNPILRLCLKGRCNPGDSPSRISKLHSLCSGHTVRRKQMAVACSAWTARIMAFPCLENIDRIKEFILGQEDVF